MCVVCIEYAKGTITAKEARAALREIANVTFDNGKMTREFSDHFQEKEEKFSMDEMRQLWEEQLKSTKPISTPLYIKVKMVGRDGK